jgi:hypothetical protein
VQVRRHRLRRRAGLGGPGWRGQRPAQHHVRRRARPTSTGRNRCSMRTPRCAR